MLQWGHSRSRGLSSSQRWLKSGRCVIPTWTLGFVGACIAVGCAASPLGCVLR